jgi:hypothetical protein
VTFVTNKVTPYFKLCVQFKNIAGDVISLLSIKNELSIIVKKLGMKEQILQYKLYGLGFLIGALTGFLYWKYVGCLTGSCTITSSPFRSTVYFGIMGALFLGLFQKKNVK